MERLDEEIRGGKIVNKIKEMRRLGRGKLKRITFQKSNKNLVFAQEIRKAKRY
jgi:hypothetical protein